MRNQKEKILFFTNELALLIKSGLTFTKAIEIILKVIVYGFLILFSFIK